MDCASSAQAPGKSSGQRHVGCSKPVLVEVMFLQGGKGGYVGVDVDNHDDGYQRRRFQPMSMSIICHGLMQQPEL